MNTVLDLEKDENFVNCVYDIYFCSIKERDSQLTSEGCQSLLYTFVKQFYKEIIEQGNLTHVPIATKQDKRMKETETVTISEVVDISDVLAEN